MSGKRGRRNDRWIREHVDDPYVRKAQQDGYRSRAVYKLIELDQKDHLLAPGITVLELGAAPGGWTQYIAQRVGVSGRVVASDILPMDALPHTEFIQGDFTDDTVSRQIDTAIGPAGADLVLSDMAPNLSGVASSDQARAIGLAELTLHSAVELLSPAGALALKVFQGEGFDPFMTALRQAFVSVKIRKPAASRPKSREVYVVARSLCAPANR